MIPHNRTAMVDGDARPTRDWYDFFRRLGQSSGIVPTDGSSQDKLISGGNIKTVNGETLLGASDVEVGYRNLPKTITGLENGKCYSISAGITINTATEGDICSVYNNSGSSVTLTQGGSLTLRVAGTATTGNYTLPQRGFVTIWWHTSTEAIIL